MSVSKRFHLQGFTSLSEGLILLLITPIFVFPNLAPILTAVSLFLLALFLFGVFEASVGLFPVYAWVLAAFFVSGFLNMAFIVPARSILQLNTPQEMRGRIFAAFSAVMNAAVLLGTMWGGALEEPLGAPRVFLLAGAMVALAAGYALLTGGIPAPKAKEA